MQSFLNCLIVSLFVAVPGLGALQMTPATFPEPGLLYQVRIGDCTKDEKEGEKPDALVYSRVTEILRVDRP